MKTKNKLLAKFNSYFTWKNFISFISSLAVYAVIISLAFWWQTRDMLSTNESVPLQKINLLAINGDSFSYDFANGHKDTLVYFFAPWCSICHLSIDNIEDLKAANRDNLNTIIIALDWKNIEEIDDFLEQHKLTSPVLLGTRAIQQSFKISAFPSYYFIDKGGNVKAKSKGYTTEIGMRSVVSINQ